MATDIVLKLAMQGAAVVGADINKVKATMGELRETSSTLQNMLATLGITVSVLGFANMIKSSIDATGALKDLAIQTGASELAMDLFRRMGAESATSADSIAGAMNKLSKNMLATSEDGKGAAIAVKALGLDFNTLIKMSVDDRMLAIATAMYKFEDGADKGAAAQALFGREGAKLLPFLKDLGENADDITSKLSDQDIALKKTQAAMADAFGDNLTKMGENTKDMMRDLTNGMTPALYQASEAFLSVTTQAGGFKDEVSKLSKDGTIAEWTRTAITRITYLMDAFEGVSVVVTSMGDKIGYWAAKSVIQIQTFGSVVAAFVSRDWTGMQLAIESGTNKQLTLEAAHRESFDETWGEKTLGAKLRARMEDLKNTGVQSETIKPQLDVKAVLATNEVATKAAAEATKAAANEAKLLAKEIAKQEDEYNKLTSSIEEKIMISEAELNSTEKLSAADKLDIKILADLRAGTLVLTDAQIDNVQAKIEKLRVTEQDTEAEKLNAKATQESVDENNKAIDAAHDRAISITEQVAKERESNDTIGKSKEALAALTIGKLYDQAATLERNAGIIDAGGAETALSAEFRAQAVALRDLAGEKAKGIHITAAQEAQAAWERTTKAIGDGLSSAFTDALFEGRSLWDAFKNYMINTILDGMIKNALSSVIQSGLNSLSGGIGTILSGLTASINSVTGGALNSITNAASNALTSITGATDSWAGLGSLFTGSGASAGGAGSVAAADAVYAGAGGGSGAIGSLFGGVEVGAGASAGGAGSVAAADSVYAGAGGGSGALGAAAVPLAAAAFVYYFNDMFGNAERAFTVMATQEQPQMTDMLTRYHETSESGDGEYQTIHSVTVQKLKYADNGEILYNLLGDGIPIETVDAATLGNTYGVTPFAAGGYHSGGLRLVGEYGPELEATGPARIWNADQTASMLRSGGASNEEVVAELASMRRLLASIYRESKRTADATNGNGESPIIVEVDA